MNTFLPYSLVLLVLLLYGLLIAGIFLASKRKSRKKLPYLGTIEDHIIVTLNEDEKVMNFEIWEILNDPYKKRDGYRELLCKYVEGNYPKHFRVSEEWLHEFSKPGRILWEVILSKETYKAYERENPISSFKNPSIVGFPFNPISSPTREDARMPPSKDRFPEFPPDKPSNIK